MTLLAMLRHAETAWSAEKRLQGRTDVPLNAAGRAALADKTLPVEFGGMRVVTSPLQRCVQTGQALGLGAAEIEPRIAEMSWGAWEGRRLSDLRLEHGESMRCNEAKGLDFMPPQGESPRQVWVRVSDWLREVAIHGVPTLGVSHRGVIRVIFASACGWNMQGRPPAKLDWSALQLFTIDASGLPTIAQLNIPLQPLPPGMPVP